MNFGGRSPYGDSFSYEGWNGHYNLVKLNLYNKNVTEHLLLAVKMWIEEFGIDGIRFDAADCLADNFIKDICRFARGIKQDFWLMGEIIHGAANRWANGEMFDSITNYQCYKGIYSSHNDRNYFEIAHSIDYQLGQNGSLYLYNFLDNHDVSRIASILNNPAHIYCCYTLMYMMHGVPSVYYGSEFGIPGIKGRGHDADLPVRPDLSQDDIAKGDGKLLKHISALGAVRNENPAVQSGSYTKLELNNQTFLFKREKEGEKVYIALNISGTSHTFRIQTDYKTLSDRLSGNVFEASGGFVSVTVPQNQSMVLTAADEEAAKTFVSGKEASEDKKVSDAAKDEQGESEPFAGRKPVPAPKNNGITGIGVPEGRKIVINGHYKHFKGGDYIVLNVAKDHEDCSEQAVYMQLGNKPVIWVRPLEMFLEDVDDHGNIKPRFELIEESSCT